MTNFICEYCGVQHSDLRTLINSACLKSPTKKHVPFKGGVRAEYICKYCGVKYRDFRTLINSACAKSPTKKHVPFVQVS